MLFKDITLNNDDYEIQGFRFIARSLSGELVVLPKTNKKIENFKFQFKNGTFTTKSHKKYGNLIIFKYRKEKQDV